MQGIGTCLPTPISPTPISPTLDEKFTVIYHRGVSNHQKGCQSNCLKVTYREDANINRLLWRTAALAFVPVRFVRLAWQAIEVSAPLLPCIQEFIRYFEDTWLVGNFLLTMWNVYQSDSFKTNNHLEGWHNRLIKWLVGKAHPNVYEFVEVIQKEQTATITQLEAGACPPRRTLKAIKRDRKIQEHKEHFDTNTIMWEEYVQRMSTHTNV